MRYLGNLNAKLTNFSHRRQRGIFHNIVKWDLFPILPLNVKDTFLRLLEFAKRHYISGGYDLENFLTSQAELLKTFMSRAEPSFWQLFTSRVEPSHKLSS